MAKKETAMKNTPKGLSACRAGRYNPKKHSSDAAAATPSATIRPRKNCLPSFVSAACGRTVIGSAGMAMSAASLSCCPRQRSRTTSRIPPEMTAMSSGAFLNKMLSLRRFIRNFGRRITTAETSVADVSAIDEITVENMIPDALEVTRGPELFRTAGTKIGRYAL